MAQNIRLEVVTPEKAVVSEEASLVMAPGSEGEFGVLTGHTPFLTTLKVGVLKYVDAAGKEKFVFINEGFAEALPEKVTVLAESAETKEDVDLARAESARDRAEKRLGSGSEEVNYVRAKASLHRAVQRIALMGM